MASPEPSHPEPACLEAQKWIEAVTGKSFGDKDFRSALENGILLCELLSAIKPGLVKKINRLPTPIAGLDNLSVFLRGCEELGLKGSQLFDPGDLQDTSIRANLKDSDCNRKLKNVLNTVFWLGKAASGCASYSGPNLNLKEFEGLLAQMKLESDECGDSSQKRSVRDSGYDCWDSERSESLSPPRHTRDNSLDSLDSFGSRSQHSPSPDVVNRGNSDGRGSDSEADAPSRKPDVRKDDMLARRTASSESRCPVPFNQFLPNRTNASCYIPAARRKQHTEEGEQRSSLVAGSAPSQATPPPVDLQPWTTESTPTPAEIDARFAQYEQRAGAEEDDEEEKEERIPDLQKDDMMARKTGVFQKQTAAYNRFLPLPGSKWCSREEAPADAAPFSKKGMQAGKSKEFSTRVDSQRPKVPDETPQHQLEAAVIRAMSQTAGGSDEDEDNYDKNDHVPDVEKDDMMARRTRLLQKASVVRGNQCFNQFLPVPGSVKCNISPVSAVKQTCNRSKHTENIDRESSIVAMTTQHEAPPLKAPASLRYPGLRGRRGKEKQEEGDTVMVPNAAVSDVTEPSSSSSSLKPPLSPPLAQIGRVEEELEVRREKEKIEEKNRDGIMKLEKKPSWLEDELPPMMVSRRVAFLLDNESVSMGDMANEEQVGHLPSLSPSRYERMQQQYNAFLEEGDHWQDDLARWKNRRRSASQELIKKEEERKRMEKRMKEDRVDGNRRKSIKTYKEIVEEKERREAELCEAYRNAATPEEAAMVLQRYALRFTISDATLDSLKLPRSTNKPKQDLNQTEQDPKLTSAVNNAEMLDHPNQPNSDVVMKQERLLARDIKTEGIHEIENSGVITTSSLTPDTNSQNEKPQSEHLYEPSTHLIDPHAEHQKQPDTGVPPPQTELASSQPAQPTHTVHSPLSAPSRPLPLLVAKPYCPPKSCPSGQKHVHVQKTDGLMRVNGEATEDFPPLQDPLQENKDVSSQQTQKHDLPEETEESPKTAEQLEHLQTEKSTLTSGSAISSLIAGRNCIITTTIVTELTKTYMELLQPDIQNNGQDGTTDYAETPAEENTEPAPSPSSMQEYSPTVSEGLEESSVTIETPMLNLAKRVNHWVWDPNEERKRLERWQQEQERLLQEQYQKEQEKLKKEWEKAQLEVEEEERKHNEEERRILEETAAPLSPSALLQKQAEHTTSSFSAEENNNTTVEGNVSLQQNGQKIHAGTQDQHASKLHFFQDSGFDDQPPKKQEMWKTASLDRSPQLNQAETVKRSGSHDAVKSNQDLSPPSASRCVSGKRLCSGCSNPLGRGAAMIIDTLGLFFHMQCFKCGVCKGQLGDATAGTDVRIRNGLLSCHECYIASRGRGQPTPL
ncbi:LIM and calponin homology domains-containing protein 1-like isoform X9 [Girardinichthys multiradiatus]|uniref:LIM and calponin homology domains-containing protein 1-like isoform X9 n=1 Tax=Girardinichthys multiradiatus TaxID=208333 RepID=UPI001FAB5A45|nr:LIM and calponin homology domains-containing protein 1-like isoform X9 [Girardinichthys multiradiatus]